jgi:translation elongation factor IF5A
LFHVLGKHGHAKVHMVGIDIFSGKKYEDICPSTHNMDVPHVKREDYQLTDIDDGFLVLMSDGGDLREDLKIPDGELGVQLRAEYDAGKELLVSRSKYLFHQRSRHLHVSFLFSVHRLEILRRRMCHCYQNKYSCRQINLLLKVLSPSSSPRQSINKTRQCDTILLH